MWGARLGNLFAVPYSLFPSQLRALRRFNVFTRIRSLWRAVARRAAWEQELEEELRAHVECRAEDLVR